MINGQLSARCRNAWTIAVTNIGVEHKSFPMKTKIPPLYLLSVFICSVSAVIFCIN